MNSAAARAETAEAVRRHKCEVLQDTCKDTDGAINAKMQSEAATFRIFDKLGRREWPLIMLHWVLPPDGGPQEVRHLPQRFSPRGRVIILIYRLPALQLLCSAVSDHLCGFIISAGAR